MKILYIVTFLIFLGCNTRNGQQVEDIHSDSTKINTLTPSEIYKIEDIDDLKRMIKEDGNSVAYEKLSTIYVSSIALLPYSFIMADEYNNAYACYDIYIVLLNCV